MQNTRIKEILLRQSNSWTEFSEAGGYSSKQIFKAVLGQGLEKQTFSTIYGVHSTFSLKPQGKSRARVLGHSGS